MTARAVHGIIRDGITHGVVFQIHDDNRVAFWRLKHA